jgi:hypothetical protein
MPPDEWGDAARSIASPPQTMEAGHVESEKPVVLKEPRWFVVARRSGVWRWESSLGGASQNWK